MRNENTEVCEKLPFELY